MPRGVARSPFIPLLAKSLGMRLQSIRDRLNKAGYHSPYLDEPRALKILESQGFDLTKYRAKRAKMNGVKIESKELPLAEPAAPESVAQQESVTAMVPIPRPSIVASPTPPPVQQTLPIPADPKQALRIKLRAAWDRKLIPRLARLLPEGSSHFGKLRAKRILMAGGYSGPRWDDEARAVEIFRQQGIDVRNFEWDQGPLNRVPTVADDKAKADAILAAQARRARTMLEQFEAAWGQEWKEGRASGVPYPISIVFEALNELRAPARRKL